MEAEQARELALNARLNHWPVHLGVSTDAEKIEHLATRLDEAATRIFSLETLEDEAQTLREERDMYASANEDLRDKLKQIYEMTYEFRDLPKVV